MLKTALITGANSGIGYAIAKLLAEKNYQVVISGRNQEKLKKAADDLSVSYFVADMGNLKQVNALAAEFKESGLDVLINNAAIFGMFPLEDCTEQTFDDYIDINVKGPIFLIKELIPALAKKRGAITNISSIITQSGFANGSIYAVTKGAIDAFTRNIALELAPKNIRVNAISPGAVDTPLLDKLGLSTDEKTDMMKNFSSIIPLKRYAKPEEIAHAVVAQLESSYTTGSNWIIDGGVTS